MVMLLVLLLRPPPLGTLQSRCLAPMWQHRTCRAWQQPLWLSMPQSCCCDKARPLSEQKHLRVVPAAQGLRTSGCDCRRPRPERSSLGLDRLPCDTHHLATAQLFPLASAQTAGAADPPLQAVRRLQATNHADSFNTCRGLLASSHFIILGTARHASRVLFYQCTHIKLRTCKLPLSNMLCTTQRSLHVCSYQMQYACCYGKA